jgi:hypothetical protein
MKHALRDKGYTQNLSSKTRSEDKLQEDLSSERREILKWIIRKLFVRVWTGFEWQKIGSSGTL